VSLLLHRRSIGRAVAGELSPRAETALRAHLRSCARCRDHYDRLASAAEAIAVVPGGRIGQERARQRLLAALEGGSAPAAPASVPAATRARRWWRATLLVAPAAAALLLFVRSERTQKRAVERPVPEVTWRGGGASPTTPAPTLLVYASRKDPAGGHGPVRIVAELPASGEGRVSLSDYVQFSVRGLAAPAFITVVGFDAAGGLHVYAPRPGGAAAPLPPSATPVAVGPSIDLQRAHRPGPLRLYALFSPEPIDEARLRAAGARIDWKRPGVAPLDLPVPQASGLLLVAP